MQRIRRNRIRRWNALRTCGHGDVRSKVRVEEFDPDPAKAAEVVVLKWKSVSEDELQNEMEEVR